MEEMFYYICVGFLAQVIDGSLGMGYGISASSLLLSWGLSPAIVSATVHASEVFTTGVSSISHHYFGNVNRRLFWSLVVPGVFGAVVGSYVLVNLPGERLEPVIAIYLLLMGVFIIIRVFRKKNPPPTTAGKHLTSLGFLGAFIDAIGGGGWGPVVASTLIARGNHVRLTVGSVNAAEFFVTLAASLTFIATMGLKHWPIIAGLAIGGAIAAPIGAYTCRKIPHHPFMLAVGTFVVFLGAYTLLKAFM